MTGDEDTTVKRKLFISKANAQNRPENIQWDTVSGISAFREQIGNSAVKRRWPPCPVCRNTSRKNGRSFLMSVAGRNTTSFVGNVKGTASRASVPPLSNAHIYEKKKFKLLILLLMVNMLLPINANQNVYAKSKKVKWI